jgi:hypothetical protein
VADCLKFVTVWVRKQKPRQSSNESIYEHDYPRGIKEEAG